MKKKAVFAVKEVSAIVDAIRAVCEVTEGDVDLIKAYPGYVSLCIQETRVPPGFLGSFNVDVTEDDVRAAL